MITDRGPVDSTAVLCCWKHLVEVRTLCSEALDAGGGGGGGGGGSV